MIELVREALRDIVARPLPYLAEVVHFVALLAIVWLVLRRTVARTLAERRRRIAAGIEAAEGAAAARADAEARAAALLAEAGERARRIGEEAAAAVAAARSEGLERIAREAAAVVRLADDAAEAERARVSRESSERLIELVGAVVRRFLDQALSEGERRALTQKLILSHLAELER
jgi:F-type H+-transporting ATPase subunit b